MRGSKNDCRYFKYSSSAANAAGTKQLILCSRVWRLPQLGVAEAGAVRQAMCSVSPAVSANRQARSNEPCYLRVCKLCSSRMAECWHETTECIKRCSRHATSPGLTSVEMTPGYAICSYERSFAHLAPFFSSLWFILFLSYSINSPMFLNQVSEWNHTVLPFLRKMAHGK